MHEDEPMKWESIMTSQELKDATDNIYKWASTDTYIDGVTISGNSISSNDILTEEEIEWVQKKMADEKEYEELAKSSAAVKIALDQLEEAKHRLKVTSHLVRTQQIND